MSTQEKAQYLPDTISEQSVADFLQENPDFFTRHEDLLLNLELPHNTGDAVSLLKYQVERLREQHATTRSKLIELVNVARENDRLSERIHKLTLALITTDSVDVILQVLEDHFYREFHAHYVKIYLFDNNSTGEFRQSEHLVTRGKTLEQQFENFFKGNRPLCGRLKKAQLDFLFADDADKIGSSVLIPLDKDCSLGMIAIGSHDDNRFHSGMGTLYLQHMGQLINASIRRFIGPPTQAS